VDQLFLRVPHESILTSECVIICADYKYPRSTRSVTSSAGTHPEEVNSQGDHLHSKHLLVQGKIEILDDVELLRELRNLREEKTPRGQIDVRPATGNDDAAVALALAVNEAVTPKIQLPFDTVPVDWRPSPASLGLIPGECHLMAGCRNCPACIDEGRCKGFVNSLIQIGQ
jgi:hypothetical protein